MAKRFVFRAEVALAMRRREEEHAQRELAAANERERQAQEARDAARFRVEEAQRRAREAEARVGAATERVWHRNWILAQRQLEERAQRLLDLRQQEVRHATAQALEAHRRRKALDRLKERFLQKWALAAERDEQKAVDELAISRHTRQETGGGP